MASPKLPMPTMAMLKSGVISAAVSAGAFTFVGKPLGGMTGFQEYGGVFLGLGTASVISPFLLAYVEKMTDPSAQVPAVPDLGKTTLMSFLYGGGIGTAVYWVINMVYPGWSDVTDVALSAVVAGAVGPYLSLPGY